MAESARLEHVAIDPEELSLWAQRAVCLLGNANSSVTHERRKGLLLKLDPKLVNLAGSDPGVKAKGLLFGDSFIKELSKHVATFSSLDEAQQSLKKMFSSRVFTRAGRGRNRFAGRSYANQGSRGPYPNNTFQDYRPQFYPQRSRGFRTKGNRNTRFAAQAATDGEPTPPEGTPAYIVMEEKGVAPCLRLKQWRKLTEKEGCLAFPEHGTFNTRVLENLRWMLSTQKRPPRPAQYEALAVWDLMALKQRQEKFQRRLRRAEISNAEARWDNESKMWRRGIVDGLKLFPAIAQGEKTQGKKASCKTDKDSNNSKENKRPWEEEDDSDDEEFMDRLLHDRPPPYAVSDSAPSTSTDPGNQTHEKGVADTVQTNDTALIQNGVSVPTAPDIPI
ncbi:hypothetical protein NDU88_003623 [Pleurodeles waltl]|uniref:Uncharacterized protein n=1 Tax=Pleurodeles waltl TaxID=8319 RepID=A0AAV7PA56_PLEWA|nr:hypothetical protein NDU88_003623 [Pleurodeles waltl]